MKQQDNPQWKKFWKRKRHLNARIRSVQAAYERDEKKAAKIAKKDMKLIDQIEAVRARNNTRWMDLVRFAFEHDPEWARQWQRDVRANDQQISELNRKLCE